MASPKRNRQRARLREAAATVAELRSDLIDVTLDEAALRTDGTMAIKLISPGWGTSGYYSPEVLEAAGAGRVFPRGTHMYWDHPSQTERTDRPERSLRDLAAVLETDGVWRDDPVQGPGLFAQAKVFEAFRPILSEMAPHIGVSVRAAGERTSGQAEGRRGMIVEKLVQGVSVDFVTKAGRGGQILGILEAAGRLDLLDEAAAVGPWFESRIHLDFTTRADDMYGDGRITKDERIALSTGIGAALDAFASTVQELAPQLLTRDLWEPPADPVNDDSQEGLDMPISNEERAAIAAEAATAVITQLTEAGVITAPGNSTEQLDEAAQATAAAVERAERAERAVLLEAARRHAEANTKVQGLPAVARTAVVDRVVNEATANEDGTLNVTALDEALTAQVDAEVKYLSEATGSVVRGVGGAGPASGEITEADEAALGDVFQRLGLSEGAAKIAVGGRR